MSDEPGQLDHPVKKFTIVREKWARGGKPNTKLLNKNGDRCCLGFFANACGYEDQDILGIGMPGAVALRKGLNLFPKWMLEKVDTLPTTETYDISECNDDSAIGEGRREATITKHFAAHGVEVEFV